MVRQHPAARIEPAVLSGRLMAALSPDRLTVTTAGKHATIAIRGVTPSTLAADAAAIKTVATDLGTHVELVEVKHDASAGEPYRDPSRDMMEVHLRTPLENTLFIRGVPETPSPPIESRRLSYGLDRLLVQKRLCPACNAEHAVFYYPKGHAGQDRDDRTFACLACARCELVAHGIPELSPYKIDLVSRLTPDLARVAQRKTSGARAELGDPRRVVLFVIATVLVFLILVLLR
jgi:hypothetical protein